MWLHSITLRVNNLARIFCSDGLTNIHLAELSNQCTAQSSWVRSGQWIVTRARLRNPGQVVPYVPVTGYNFIHRVRLKARVKNDNFENSRFPIFGMLPCGRPRFWKNTIFHFVDVALRAASILKNRIFCICLTSSRWQNTCIWLDLSIRSVLERLVLKKYAECTSQRLKRTSGARVMIFVFDEHWRTFKKVDLRVSNFKKVALRVSNF